MADGTYRFQQPGAGQFYFQTQPQQQLSHQRNTIQNGTNSPGRLKFNNNAPSPSRSPPVSQSASLNPFNMYGQSHQGQHVMMNGGQTHQRFAMQMPKFQTQTTLITMLRNLHTITPTNLITNIASLTSNISPPAPLLPPLLISPQTTYRMGPQPRAKMILTNR